MQLGFFLLDRLQDLRLDPVDFLTGLRARLAWKLAQRLELFGQHPLLAQIPDPQGFQRLHIAGRCDLREGFALQGIEISHGYNPGSWFKQKKGKALPFPFYRIFTA